MGMSIKPSLDWKNAHLPSLVYVLTSLSLLVMTLKREDINGELVIAIGVLLHCEYYIQYKTINKTYLCALDNSLPEHQGCFGGHHRSRLANQNIPLAVDQGSWARVCAQALVHEAPFFVFVLKVRIPSPSPSISWQAIHLQGFSWGTCEILIKKKRRRSFIFRREDVLWAAQCGTPECSASAIPTWSALYSEKKY